jgi:hypothetical protein
VNVSVLIAVPRVSVSGDTVLGVTVMIGQTRKLPLHVPEHEGYVALVAVTVIAYRPTGEAVVVEIAPVLALMVIPLGGVPPKVQVNVPLMPLALGLVVCV